MADMIPIVIPILIVAVVVAFVWHLWRRYQEKKAGFAVKDERTARIEGKAGRITVLVSGYFMLSLLWYDFANNNFKLGLPELETAWALIISVLFNSILYASLIWYFSRKGD